jgi:hypothetical protein
MGLCRIPLGIRGEDSTNSSSPTTIFSGLHPDEEASFPGNMRHHFGDRQVHRAQPFFALQAAEKLPELELGFIGEFERA